MNEDNKSRVLPISGLLLMFAALSVMIYNKAPFEGSRPPDPEIREQCQKVKARLWQDPFLAVLQDTNTSNPPKEACFCLHSSCRSHKPLEQFATKLSGGKVTVVGVMVFGAPYAEEGEQRIRKRYAVLSAFHRLGFAPEDPEHIEYVRIVQKPNEENTEAQNSPASMADIMPFEWLKKENGENDSILLLWINDDVFHDKPLDKLLWLSNCLPKYFGGSFQTVRLSKVIGPAGSTTLGGMMREVKEMSKTTSKEFPFTIYSPTATVDDSILLQGSDDSSFAKDPSDTVKAEFNQARCTLYRTNCSDGQLAEKIRDELRIRGIDCRNSKNHIVLLSEWDTYYGRSLMEVYKRAFYRGGVVNFDRQIHTYSFLRGVDGKIPDEKESGETSGKKKEKNSDGGKTAPDTAKELEHATGMSQYDYIRRLADEIYSFEKHLEDRGSIRAIGVLGSDFHDKYLLLQALRQRFPQAVFFTTDLDARFLHPDAFPWTRNLIVASSFNLGLRNDDAINVQGDIPPFRDSSQTAVFYTILRSFEQGGYLDRKLQNVVRQKPKPKIFEIGRYRAVDLSEDPSDVNDAGSFEPRYQEAKNSIETLRKVVMISLLLFVLLSFSSEQMRTMIVMAFSGRKRVVVTLALLSVMVLLIQAFYHCILLNPHQEEPFSFLEGVSIWPTVLLRFFAALLSLCLIWRAHAKIRENTAAICIEFGFYSPPREKNISTTPDHSTAAKDRTGILGDISRMFRKFSDVIRYDWNVEKPAQGAKLTIDHYWSEYCRRDSCQYRFRRLAPIIVSYISMCSLIISLSMPETPVRGHISIMADRVILSVSVLATIFLIFYTFDAIKTCHRFTDLLSKQSPRWSDLSFSNLVGSHSENAKKSMREWMVIHLIARRTECVGKVVFYPFIVWSILFISRFNYFDNWHTPIGLAVVITLGAVYAWSCALVLRRSAERARQAALDRLMMFQVSVVAGGADEQQLKRIDFATESVKSIRAGAFAPYIQNPVVQALMVPFGGVGGMYALDFLGKLNI
jgi:hypothetical protein